MSKSYEKFRGFLQKVVEGDDWEYGDGTSMTQDAKEFLALLQNIIPSGATISDSFGSTWSAYCPECGKKTMQIVRPGHAECSECV